MFATSEEIDELLGDSVGADAFALRIGGDSPVYAVRLAQALMSAHPEAVVEVRIDNAREALARLHDAQVDVAILSDPPMDGQFFYEPLFADYLAVCTPADHPLAKAEVFPLEALARERLLMREAASKTRTAIEVLLAAADVIPERVVELHGREAIREAIALGMGVSLFFSAECPPDPRIACLRPDRQPDRAQLTGYVVCRIERRRTPMMRAALAAAETLKALSPLPLHNLEPAARRWA
jgi:DNA-binding transcriptional LysR family regulator